MATSERTPLLADDRITSPERREPPPPYSSAPEPTAESFLEAAVLSVETHELPPPYTPSAHGNIPVINCKVCQAVICLEGRQHSYVVKCSLCGEATPLRAAPLGKKYIRCTCNILLICPSGATKILCPRERCKRVLTLPRTGTESYNVPEVPRYVCAYCNQIFALEVFTKLTRCPHCRRLSSVGRNYARARGHAYFLGGVVFLGMSVALIIFTYNSVRDHIGVVVAWISGFLLGVMFIVQSVYYYGVRTSPEAFPAFNT
ncbi:unnamed protein product [Candidula unifasciata]|uniref:Phosphatidylinositol-4,5-bisphosphate 4-phosphatase n=1 Tax=Candidula unifasciata TaxID=100452 RepID=A0A8S3YZQ4_9EUPU|nr:unnamed protein product [Candidula unifasciata]